MSHPAYSGALPEATPSLAPARMRRVGPLIAKSSEEMRRHGNDEFGSEPEPSPHLRDLCLTPRCRKPHYHVDAEKCERYADPERSACEELHYHSQYPERLMRRIIRSEGRIKEELPGERNCDLKTYENDCEGRWTSGCVICVLCVCCDRAIRILTEALHQLTDWMGSGDNDVGEGGFLQLISVMEA